VDELRGVGKWASDKLARERERERLRVEDRLRQLDEVDAVAREFKYLRNVRPGYAWGTQSEKGRLRLLGLGPIIGDPDAEAAIADLIGQDRPSDESYLALARCLAILRARTFTPDA
jgi:hypothetical protein